MTPKVAHDVFDGYTSKQLLYVHPDKSFVGCNPSIHHDGTTWRCIVRCVNYRLGGHIPERPRTENAMLELAPKWWQDDKDHAHIVRADLIADRTGVKQSGYPIAGYEDCRLFQWQTLLWATATTCHLTPHGHREICVLGIDPTGDGYQFSSCHPLRGPWSVFYQKNWIPCVTVHGQLRVVYSLDRAMWLGIGGDDADMEGIACGSHAYANGVESRIEDMNWRAVGDHRGSSCGVHLPGNRWLVLVHGEDYRSRFVICDGDTHRPQFMTEPFNFRARDIEFAAGMAAFDNFTKLVVSYSVRDCTTELGIFPLAAVMSKMERIA